MIKNHNEAGFTLFEMALALMIFSMVGLLITGIMFSVQRSWANIHKHSAKLDGFLKIERLADSTFKNAIPFTWTNDNLKEVQVFQGEPEAVTFAYLHRINNISAGAIRFVKLFVEDKKLIASYRNTPILFWKNDPQSDQAKREVLAENVEKISFDYADREADEITWSQDWDEENKTQIPLAVMMTITLENGTSERWLRRTAGSSYDTSLGKREYSVK